MYQLCKKPYLTSYIPKCCLDPHSLDINTKVLSGWPSRLKTNSFPYSHCRKPILPNISFLNMKRNIPCRPSQQQIRQLNKTR